MPKNLHKIQKQVAKKRGGKSNTLNENSRDAKRIQRAGMREEKLARQFAVREKANEGYLGRVRFFQNAVADRTEGVDEEYLRTCPEEFSSSLHASLRTLQSSRRPGRPPHPSENKLELACKETDSEWTSGFWMPDLRDTENLIKLQDWDGRWGSLATVRFVRVHRGSDNGGSEGSGKGGGQITESTFPPRGLS